MSAKVVWAGTTKYGLWGNGKQSYFIGIANPILQSLGIKTHELKSILDLQRIPSPGNTIVCLIYNEEFEIDPEVEQIEIECSKHFENVVFIHPLKIGKIIGNKRLTAKFFLDNKIPTPALVEHGIAENQVFSNTLYGSGSRAKLLETGAELDKKRFNTRFINTVHEFNHREYYVSLRSMAFGRRHICTYVRCRSVDDENSSVHAADTPLDVDLLNFLYCEIILNRQKSLVELSEALGNCLGDGFWCHDILPCADSNDLYVCETGIKLDEIALRQRLAPLKKRVLMSELYDGLESVKTAYAFASFVKNR